jgi:hypothetical protein
VGAAQLPALRGAVERGALANATIVQGAAGSTNLPAACCDAILVRDVYHHLMRIPDEINRSLVLLALTLI